MKASRQCLTRALVWRMCIYVYLCVCVCVCVFIELHITAQSGPVICSCYSAGCYPLGFFLFVCLFLISLIAVGPHHYHPACGHKGSFHLCPVHALQFFYRDASSALLQLVNQWLNFTYSRSHAFRYERKNTNPTLVRLKLTTSALAGVQLTY